MLHSGTADWGFIKMQSVLLYKSNQKKTMKLMQIAAILVLLGFSHSVCLSQTTSVTPYVDPFFGIDKGNVFPGASVPFGVVKLSPDIKFPYPTSGYTFNGEIEGFSHTHTSGTGGAPRYGNILVIPRAGKVDPKNSSVTKKANEYARPGYYTVTLSSASGDVISEVTASSHVGVHRYRFKNGSKEKHTDGTILIDIGHTLTRKGSGASNCTEGEAKIISDREIEGFGSYSGGWGGINPYKIYFVAQFDQPFNSYGTFSDTVISQKSLQIHTSGDNKFGVFAGFKVLQNQPVQLKVSLSFISLDKARKNLNKVSGLGFDEVRLMADSVWNDYLSKIIVEGGTPEQRAVFYSALHHTVLMPTDMTGENPVWQSDKPHYWDHYALWDVFRSVMPLYTLIIPEKQEKIIQNLLDIYDHKGWLPDAWIAGDFAQVQGGSNADVVIADAVVKGLKGFDIEKAYKAILKNGEVISDQPRLYGRYLEEYLKYGYCTGNVINSCSRTLEYAYNDFCISQVAKNLGEDADYKKYLKRSQNSFLLLSDSLKFVWGRDGKGNWEPDFKPVNDRPDPWNDTYFYEEGSAIYSTYFPHDMQGLINRIGGNDSFSGYLDNIFSKGFFDLNNEPAFLIPYLYNYCGRPDKTAYRVHESLRTLFSVGNTGLPGQDDSGAMSSWYVFSAMGFFPVAGQDIYLIGSPVFSKITIKPGNEKTFVIKANHLSPDNIYVQSALLNGKPLNKCWFRHSDIDKGGELVLEMGRQPSEWGKTDLPPSVSSGKTQTEASTTIWELNRLETIGGYPASAFPQPPEIIETSLGKALHFNGIDQGLLVNGNPLGNAKSFTIEVIFKPDSSSNPLNYAQRFVHIMKPGHEEKRLLLELRLKKNQQWALDSYLLSGSSGLGLLDTSLCHPAGRWYHIALVYDNMKAANYVNGVKELSGNVYYSPVAGGQTSIGVRQTRTSWYKGAIKCIRFTPHALEPSGFMKMELE